MKQALTHSISNIVQTVLHGHALDGDTPGGDGTTRQHLKHF